MDLGRAYLSTNVEGKPLHVDGDRHAYMGYTIAVPITDKRSETVCKAYRDSVYCIFGGSSSILTDNGTEFKKQRDEADL